jgi:cytochrome bd-type quinol oxidase subunit 2
MNKTLKQLLILICLVVLLVLPYFVFAGPLQRLEAIREQSGYVKADNTSIATMAGIVVRAFLSLLGVIFIILILLGGYHWMTAAGDEEKVTKAKKTIQRAIIGLLIVVGSYAIWRYIWIYLVVE